MLTASGARDEPGTYAPARGWVVMLEPQAGRWGGEQQRARVFRVLADRTDAQVVEGFTPRALRAGFGGLGYVPLPLPRLGRERRPRLAASDPLRPDVLVAVRRLAEPVALAYYDDPIAQTEALGIRLTRPRRWALQLKRAANLAAFRWHVVPSASFGELVRLDPARVIVTGNATDTTHIRPGPWPARPTIGMISGAAPGRGIETLIAAARATRDSVPDLRLLLWLVATGRATGEYLATLRRSVAGDEWIEIGSAPYAELGTALSRATVLCIPHPPGAYMDVALPVKLYDSMAAGRPLVVTPRTETRALVERHGAGVVADGDTPEALAAALTQLIGDESLARRMGSAARRAAESEYDWDVVGDRLATTLLEREAS